MFGLLGIAWGGSFVAIDAGLSYFPPVLFAGLRYGVAGLVVLGYAAVTAERWYPRNRRDLLAVLATGSLVIAAYPGLLYLGQEHVSGPVAAVLVSLSPVLTAAFATLLLGERVDALGSAGMVLGFAGVVLVANPVGANAPHPVGVLLILTGTAAFALGGVALRAVDHDLPLRSVQAWSMLLGSVLLLATGIARGESPTTIQWTLPAVATLGYLATVSGAFAYLLYFTLLDRLGPTEINLIAYVEPVVATALGWVVLDATVGTTTLGGFAVVFAGFALVKRTELLELATAATARVGLAPNADG